MTTLFQEVSPERDLLTRENPYPQVFKGCASHADISIHNKPLHASVEKYHSNYNPLKDYDLLISYGAVDEVLPGRTAEESILIYDIVI